MLVAIFSILFQGLDHDALHLRRHRLIEPGHRLWLFVDDRVDNSRLMFAAEWQLACQQLIKHDPK